jgi:hypothetical protein
VRGKGVESSKGRIIEDLYCAVAVCQEEVFGRIHIGEARLIRLKRLRMSS